MEEVKSAQSQIQMELPRALAASLRPVVEGTLRNELRTVVLPGEAVREEEEDREGFCSYFHYHCHYISIIICSLYHYHYLYSVILIFSIILLSSFYHCHHYFSKSILHCGCDG